MLTLDLEKRYKAQLRGTIINMKTFLNVLFCVLFFNTGANALESCTLELKGMMFNRETKEAKNSRDRSIEGTENFTETWESCYKLAVQMAADNKAVIYERIPVYDGNNAIKTYSAETPVEVLLYVEWEFDDGIIDDSDGEVTKYSDINKPVLGDDRVDKYGNFYDYMVGNCNFQIMVSVVNKQNVSQRPILTNALSIQYSRNVKDWEECYMRALRSTIRYPHIIENRTGEWLDGEDGREPYWEWDKIKGNDDNIGVVYAEWKYLGSWTAAGPAGQVSLYSPDEPKEGDQRVLAKNNGF